jgi:CDP-diacylglycerol---glycerol-3-phosphate 3-phosphatidyltransferase
MTFTGAIGAAFMLPLRAIINTAVALGIHPNVLTLIGVLINVVAAFFLATDQFITAGIVILIANIFDFIDGKVAHITGTQSQFGAFWDSTLDRFSDLALFTGMIWLYAHMGRYGYVLVATLSLIFSIMTSYARARAESLIDKCDVGFMERPERIVLIVIGAFTDRMAGVLWVILVLAIITVSNRIYYTYLVLNNKPMPEGLFARFFFWRDQRATLPYDVWVIVILAFVWLVPPDWISDPTASGMGLLAFLQ